MIQQGSINKWTRRKSNHSQLPSQDLDRVRQLIICLEGTSNSIIRETYS